MEYGTDLTKQAEEGRLDPVVGRAKEIERVTQILGRRTKVRHALSTSLHPGGWGNRVSSLSHGAYGRVPPHLPFGAVGSAQAGRADAAVGGLWSGQLATSGCLRCGGLSVGSLRPPAATPHTG
jgi:hypothetical protein